MARPSIEPHLRLSHITADQLTFLKRVASTSRYDYTADDSETAQIGKRVRALARRELLTDDGRYAAITDKGRALIKRASKRTRTGPLRIEPRNKEPLVRELFAFVEARSMTNQELTQRAGLHINAMHQWFNIGRSPSVSNLNAVGNVLGYKLAWVPMKQGGSDAC